MSPNRQSKNRSCEDHASGSSPFFVGSANGEFVFNGATVLDFRHGLLGLESFGAEEQTGNHAAALGTSRKSQTWESALPPTKIAGPKLRAGFTLTPVM